MTPWSEHVAAYRAKNGGTLKEAMKGASATYAKKEGTKERAPRSEASKAKSALKKAELKVATMKAKAAVAADPDNKDAADALAALAPKKRAPAKVKAPDDDKATAAEPAKPAKPAKPTVVPTVIPDEPVVESEPVCIPTA